MLNISSPLLMSNSCLFHSSGENKMNSDCVFDNLKDARQGSTPVEQNRDSEELKRRSDEDMIQDIITLHKKCKGLYDLTSANCEQLATVIRYGSASCIQVCLFL